MNAARVVDGSYSGCDSIMRTTAPPRFASPISKRMENPCDTNRSVSNSWRRQARLRCCCSPGQRTQLRRRLMSANPSRTRSFWRRPVEAPVDRPAAAPAARQVARVRPAGRLAGPRGLAPAAQAPRELPELAARPVAPAARRLARMQALRRAVAVAPPQARPRTRRRAALAAGRRALRGTPRRAPAAPAAAHRQMLPPVRRPMAVRPMVERPEQPLAADPADPATARPVMVPEPRRAMRPQAPAVRLPAATRRAPRRMLPP